MKHECLTLIQYKIEKGFKYKVNLISEIIFIPLIIIVQILILNKFINTVSFYGVKIEYLYVFLLGYIGICAYLLTIEEFIQEFNSNTEILMYSSKLAWIFANIVWTIILVSIINVILAVVLSLVGYISFFKFLIISEIESILSVFFASIVGIFLCGLSIVFRKDVRLFVSFLEIVGYVVLPVAYSLSIVGQKTRFIIETVVPISGYIEELRKLYILGTFSLKVLLLSLVVNIIYFILIYYCFIYIFNKSRKSGIISLE